MNLSWGMLIVIGLPHSISIYIYIYVIDTCKPIRHVEVFSWKTVVVFPYLNLLQGFCRQQNMVAGDTMGCQEI
jgi:hypothetical protein